MGLATWNRSMSLPTLSISLNLTIRSINDLNAVTKITDLSGDEVQQRWQNGNRIYAAFFEDQPTAYGWVAAQNASVGELNLQFGLSHKERYLWDFSTLPQWRGIGIYPQLLQSILYAENEAQRFWIIYAPENHASRKGILRSGFSPVGKLSFLKSHQGIGLVPTQPGISLYAASVFNVVLLDDENRIAPCWRCVLNMYNTGVLSLPTCWIETCGCSLL